jgi:hypothetical protein
MYGYGYVKSKQIFDAAAEIDAKDFGHNRVFTNMVRISSVRKALGVTIAN